MNPTQPTAPASMATHTPTPWYDESTNRSSANIVSADHVIAYVYDRNDRAFIVRVCNSHAQLVAALEIIAGIKSGPCPVMHTLENAQDFARAALTAAQP